MTAPKESAPVLTKEMAVDAAELWESETYPMTAEERAVHDALKALAEGRTVCVDMATHSVITDQRYRDLLAIEARRSPAAGEKLPVARGNVVVHSRDPDGKLRQVRVINAARGEDGVIGVLVEAATVYAPTAAPHQTTSGVVERASDRSPSKDLGESKKNQQPALTVAQAFEAATAPHADGYRRLDVTDRERLAAWLGFEAGWEARDATPLPEDHIEAPRTAGWHAEAGDALAYFDKVTLAEDIADAAAWMARVLRDGLNAAVVSMGDRITPDDARFSIVAAALAPPHPAAPQDELLRELRDVLAWAHDVLGVTMQDERGCPTNDEYADLQVVLNKLDAALQPEDKQTTTKGRDRKAASSRVGRGHHGGRGGA